MIEVLEKKVNSLETVIMIAESASKWQYVFIVKLCRNRFTQLATLERRHCFSYCLERNRQIHILSLRHLSLNSTVLPKEEELLAAAL